MPRRGNRRRPSAYTTIRQSISTATIGVNKIDVSYLYVRLPRRKRYNYTVYVSVFKSLRLEKYGFFTKAYYIDLRMTIRRRRGRAEAGNRIRVARQPLTE